jgi:hypothetical protein
MATTSPDNIRYPVSTDQIAPLETHFANLANDVQTALTTTSTGTSGVLIHKVANQSGRDALYPSPIQGQQVFRNDTGLLQTYYGLYNSATNPGGRATAGWYNNGGGSRKVADSTLTGGWVTSGTPGTAWNTHHSINFISTGALTKVSFTAMVQNGDSGGVRELNARMRDGSTNIGIEFTALIVPWYSDNKSDWITHVGHATFTPTAGPHTLNLQFYASAYPAVVLKMTNLVAEELYF